MVKAQHIGHLDAKSFLAKANGAGELPIFLLEIVSAQAQQLRRAHLDSERAGCSSHWDSVLVHGHLGRSADSRAPVKSRYRQNCQRGAVRSDMYVNDNFSSA
jgi:hypothetical protein